jgi:2,4-dienoyl-CoA reductase-like NADH-dependent reductase (Old Yellow Enzyme family)
MPTLLSPLAFAGLRLRNRIVMPPMCSGEATPEGFVTPAIVDYHRRRAAAGCALVIVEHTFVHPQGRHSEGQMGVHGDGAIEGLGRLASAIRAEGAAACLQLAHAGSRARRAVTGTTPVGPSPIRHPYEPDGDVPEELTPDRIAGIAAAFGAAARRAAVAGFDAVEIHAAHGYLLSQFLSPLTNRRGDDYGGPLDARARIHREVLVAVRRQVGPLFPVFVRLGVDDETPGGLEIEDGAAVAACLADNGVNLVDVSGGLQGSRGAGKGPGYFVPYARAVRSRVSVPVLVTGGIADPASADEIVREEWADLVAVGRAMLNDADWARKAIEQLAAS